MNLRKDMNLKNDLPAYPEKVRKFLEPYLEPQEPTYRCNCRICLRHKWLLNLSKRQDITVPEEVLTLLDWYENALSDAETTVEWYEYTQQCRNPQVMLQIEEVSLEKGE